MVALDEGGGRVPRGGVVEAKLDGGASRRRVLGDVHHPADRPDRAALGVLEADGQPHEVHLGHLRLGEAEGVFAPVRVDPDVRVAGPRVHATGELHLVAPLFAPAYIRRGRQSWESARAP